MFSLPSLRDLGYMVVELLCCLLLAWGWGLYQHHLGVTSVKQQEKVVVQTTQGKSEVATKTIIQTQYVPQIQYIKGATITLTKKVPIYVTQKEDVAAPIPTSFVQLWNDTNQMRISDDSPGISNNTSAVVLSDIAAQHIEESSICHAGEAQNAAMRAWMLSQRAIYDQK